MKQIASIIAVMQVFFLQAQNFENNWTGYFSYASLKSISQGNDKIYAAAENSIFIYDLSTQETETISTINGLSGKEITTAYYSENYGLYVVGYKNGLIERFKEEAQNFWEYPDCSSHVSTTSCDSDKRCAWDTTGGTCIHVKDYCKNTLL